MGGGDTMISSLFKSKKVVEAEKDQKIMEKEIKRLSLEIVKKDGFLKCKNDLFISKEKAGKKVYDWEKMGDELKKYHEENIALKKELEKINKILSIDCVENHYLIKIEKFLSEIRFSESVNNLKLNGVLYVQCLNDYIIESLVEDEKLRSEILKRYKNFLNGIMNWELKTNLLKGEKITKIYSKYRKVINILNEKTICYMDELNHDILDRLVESGYSQEEIKTLKDIYDDYEKKYLVK
ncbi:hypothetical protein HMPREF0202_01090 [Cetobacterium somerae ATCC BAA-474]|uniref:Uncharacterized protein n=2 Tax=Cetobacterium TaxID=180162 RepID=U7VBS4_9FUSO|nr:hypothetical protein HMPREF0202_01090 [Cetobacterium somerae ATCC BAA-474]